MTFTLDPTLLDNSIELADWPLCTVLLKNERQYAWCILIPKRENISDITQLDSDTQIALMQEIDRLAKIIHHHFQPDKLNIATIGNKVSQLHIHVVGRFKHDPLWPESIWQAKYQPHPYPTEQWQAVIDGLRKNFCAEISTL